MFRIAVFTLLMVIFISIGSYTNIYAEEIVIYNYEEDVQGWEVPGWAQGNEDYVGGGLKNSNIVSSDGDYSLHMFVDFKGGKKWAGAYAEKVMDVNDWTDFYGVKADVYLPEDAPKKLGARFIFTIGDDWVWTEMNRTITLEPGKWTTITANVREDSLDWRYFLTKEFRKNIRKIGIRIETQEAPPYSGSVYIDNVRVFSEQTDL